MKFVTFSNAAAFSIFALKMVAKFATFHIHGVLLFAAFLYQWKNLRRKKN